MNASAKFLTAQVKTISPDKPVVTYYVSGPHVDRDGEMILPSAYVQDLPIYKSNPVFLWQHPWMYDHPPKINVLFGHALDARVTDDALEMDFQYAVDINPDAKSALDHVRAGDLRAVSVGYFEREFVTLKSPQAQLDALPDFARMALLTGACTKVHTRVELFEVSQVLVGSLREALAVQRAIKAKEATMADGSNKNIDASGAHGKAGHPVGNDIIHRLHGVAHSLSPSWRDEDNKEGEKPPAADKCTGAIKVLKSVIGSLKDLGGMEEDSAPTAAPTSPAAPAATASSAPTSGAPTSGASSKSGAKFSKDSKDKIQTVIDGLDDHAKALQAHKKSLEDMISIEDEDESEDDGNDLDGESRGVIGSMIQAAFKAT